MSDLFSQLGVNIPMLLAQAVNFAVLLFVLSIFVYRPLMKTMEERRKKIELGIRGSELVETKLAEAEILKQEKLSEADKKAVKIIGIAEEKAGKKSVDILAAAQIKGDLILRQSEQVSLQKRNEELEKLSRDAGNLIREAISAAVRLDPESIDKKLIEQATRLIKERI